MFTITTSQFEELDQASKVLKFIIKMNRDIIQDFKSGLGPDSQDPAATFAEMSSGLLVPRPLFRCSARCFRLWNLVIIPYAQSLIRSETIS